MLAGRDGQTEESLKGFDVNPLAILLFGRGVSGTQKNIVLVIFGDTLSIRVPRPRATAIALKRFT
jgi:hypothetical protein